ncbi:hypothetical protein [Clostridium sp.]|uniref:hypothetical protein n=1 Tax=Clostridium sp. TaxID=1506 RepID=UPI003D6C8620
MEKKTFTPNWYLDRQNIIRDKKIKICIIVVLLANVFLIATIINISKKTSILDQSTSVENNINILESFKPDTFIIEKYKQISDFLTKSNLTYKNIIITGSSLEIDIEARSYEEYIYVIRCIENEYSIKKLIPGIKNKENEDNFNFKVILGV